MALGGLERPINFAPTHRRESGARIGYHASVLFAVKGLIVHALIVFVRRADKLVVRGAILDRFANQKVHRRAIEFFCRTREDAHRCPLRRGFSRFFFSHALSFFHISSPALPFSLYIYTLCYVECK